MTPVRTREPGDPSGWIDVGDNPRDVALFASDMHLDESDPDAAGHFFAALHSAATDATHLFLLGDLFEAWTGDDHDDTPVTGAFIRRLRALVAAGVQIFVMRGNRDFLIDVPLPGASPADASPADASLSDASLSDASLSDVRPPGVPPPDAPMPGMPVSDVRPSDASAPDTAPPGRRPHASFTSQAGARLIGDPVVIQLFGRRVVLAHGDALCTGDVDYQRARALVRSDAWQSDFLARTRDERLTIARSLRDASQRAQATRPPDGEKLADVDDGAVVALLREHDADVLIHGHTHRPGLHRYPVDGRVRERRVLPDWYPARAGQVARGGFLRVGRSGWEMTG